GGGFAGGALDTGGGDHGDQIVQNQAAPLTEGNANAVSDHEYFFITLDCSQSIGLANHDIPGEEKKDTPEFTYLIKAIASFKGHPDANVIVQIIDRDKNHYLYKKTNDNGYFEFQITLSSHPMVEFYVTDLDPTSLLSTTWADCGANDSGICPQPTF